MSLSSSHPSGYIYDRDGGDMKGLNGTCAWVGECSWERWGVWGWVWGWIWFSVSCWRLWTSCCWCIADADDCHEDMSRIMICLQCSTHRHRHTHTHTHTHTTKVCTSVQWILGVWRWWIELKTCFWTCRGYFGRLPGHRHHNSQKKRTINRTHLHENWCRKNILNFLSPSLQ